MEALSIVYEVANGLLALHENKIAHRNIKPESIFIKITPEGQQLYKISHFSSAKDSDSLTVLFSERLY